MSLTDDTMSSSTQRLMTVAEFASAIGRSKRQVFRYVAQGRLVAVTTDDVSHQAIRIPESEVMRFSRGQGLESMTSDVITSLDDTAKSDTMAPHVTDAEQPRRLWRDASEGVSLERYEAAVMRLGWLQGELESTRRALTDGGAREAELQRRIESEAAARRQAELQAAVLNEVRQREQEARLELEAVRGQLREQEAKLEAMRRMPWWKKVFSKRWA